MILIFLSLANQLFEAILAMIGSFAFYPPPHMSIDFMV